MAARQSFDVAGYVDKISNLFYKIMSSPLEFKVPDDMSDLDLTNSQFQGLLFILQHEECSVGELADGLSISHPAAVKMIDRLQKKSLVTKVEGKIDRRISNVCLTDTGREIAEKVQRERLAVLWKALERLKPEEIEGLVRGLEALLEVSLTDEKDIKSVCLRCGSEHIGCCVINRKHVAITGLAIEKT
jgi:DNA-binding MarR family transcriptional regulator